MNYLKVLLIFVLFITDCYGVKDKFVSITLDAKWLDTPLHQEARYIYIYINIKRIQLSLFSVNFLQHKVHNIFGR